MVGISLLAQALVESLVLLCPCMKGVNALKQKERGRRKARLETDSEYWEERGSVWCKEGKAFRTRFLPYLPVALGRTGEVSLCIISVSSPLL